MPTTRGWAALGASLALAALWVGFGETLLLGVAIFLVLAVALGGVYVRRGVPRVGARRIITPTQVHDGDRAVVELELVTGSRVHQVAVSDTVHRLGSAQFVAHRLEPGTPVVARYEVLSRPRGIYQVGPTSVLIRDPLAMAEAGGTTGRVDRLVVYPAVEDLVGLPVARGHDPTVNTSRSSFAPTGGEDFFTLREYQQGDDLRRVHWPSSAKRDDLMIKQLEMPWQSEGARPAQPASTQLPDGRGIRTRGARELPPLSATSTGPGSTRPCGWGGEAPRPSDPRRGRTRSPWRALAVADSMREMVSLPALLRRLLRGGIAGGAFDPRHRCSRLMRTSRRIAC